MSFNMKNNGIILTDWSHWKVDVVMKYEDDIPEEFETDLAYDHPPGDQQDICCSMSRGARNLLDREYTNFIKMKAIRMIGNN